MAKKVVAKIKLIIPAGQAKAGPPVGPALGQRGLNIMEFVKAFNAFTTSGSVQLEVGTPVPVEITAYEDRSFTFITRTPPATYFIKKFANITKGSSATRKESSIGKIKMSDCREIAKIKAKDLNAFDIEAGAKIIRGSAESMGLDIIED
ncbi:MAG: rplK [Rickettsiaceae bacterium]|jgi:large subunit ribosomal protein L11|nr:rplK [Rickettsiaceae bacterium]